MWTYSAVWKIDLPSILMPGIYLSIKSNSIHFSSNFVFTTSFIFFKFYLHLLIDISTEMKMTAEISMFGMSSSESNSDVLQNNLVIDLSISHAFDLSSLWNIVWTRHYDVGQPVIPLHNTHHPALLLHGSSLVDTQKRQ